MSEQLKNFGLTTLNGAINNSTTSVVVADGSVFPTTGVFTVLVDNELMRVTSRSTNTLAVVRGEEGTSAASHSDGAGCRNVQTARGVEAFRAEHITTGAYSGFSGGRRGRLYLPTDSGLMIYERDSGIKFIGPDFEPRTLPVTANFSWQNQGGATITDYNDFSQLIAPANSGDSLRMREINLPTAPWSVTVEMDAGWLPVNFLTAGLYMRESGTGKIRSFGFHGNATAGEIGCINWTNATTFSAGVVAKTLLQSGRAYNCRWHKLLYDGTNIVYSIGPSKNNIQYFDQRTIGTFFTTGPNRVGFYANSNNTGRAAILNVYSWEEGTS